MGLKQTTDLQIEDCQVRPIMSQGKGLERGVRGGAEVMQPPLPRGWRWLSLKNNTTIPRIPQPP